MKVILVIADTLRRDHLGCYGNRWIRTPNIDRFAAASACFENAVVGSFPTVPNRRDIQLGRGDQGLPFNRWKGLERYEVTLPQRLTAAGIPCMWIGDTQNNVTKTINLQRDFSAWWLNRGQEADPCWLDDSVPLAFPVPPELIRYRPEVWHRVLMNRAHRMVETDWFAPGTYQQAIRWLQRNARRQDFFLWIDTFDPHEPWDPPQHYIDLYDPGYSGRIFEAPTYGLRRSMGITDREIKHVRARYAGEVTMVDTWFGHLLETIDHLGIGDDTLLVFTSDHGTMFDTTGDNGLICKPHTVGADGMCMSAGRPMPQPHMHFPILPNVARIPLIVRAPGMTHGTRIKGFAQPWDLTTTILDAFGIPIPDDLIGTSLLPVVRGKELLERRVAVCGCNNLAQAVTERWIYTAWQDQRPPSLLDLKNDPDASRNVVTEHPSVVTRLRAAVCSFMKRQDIPTDIIRSYRFTP